MRDTFDIYAGLLEAEGLEEAVRALPDDELRTLRGAMARGEFPQWPADMIHGVCIIEGCERFMRMTARTESIIREDRDHGAEVQP